MSAGEEKKRGERGERRGEKKEEKREGKRKAIRYGGAIMTTELISSMSTPAHPENYHRLIALTGFLHCCTEIEIVDIAPVLHSARCLCCHSNFQVKHLTLSVHL